MATTSTLIVKNMGTTTVTVNGLSIAAGASHTFLAATVVATLQDLVLRSGLVTKTLQANLNGLLFGAAGHPMDSSMIDVVNGVISGSITLP